MLRWLRTWLAGLVGSTGDSEESAAAASDHEGETPGEDGGFLRSRLDASVLVAHGQGDPAATSEIRDLQEEAATLREQDRYR